MEAERGLLDSFSHASSDKIAACLDSDGLSGRILAIEGMHDI